MGRERDVSPTKPLFYNPLRAYWNTFLTQSEWEIFRILACGPFENFRNSPLFNFNTAEPAYLPPYYCVSWFKAFVDYLRRCNETTVADGCRPNFLLI